MKIAKQQCNFFLSISVLKNLKSHIPKGEQSRFVEHSINAGLSSMQFQKALDQSFGSWKNNSHTETQKFIRDLRKSQRMYS